MAICPTRTRRESPRLAHGSDVAADPQDGEIGFHILTNELSRHGLPVRERDAGVTGAMNHMAIGEHESIGREDDP